MRAECESEVVSMDIMEIRRRMQSGELYFCNDETLMAEQMERLDKVFAYNQLPPADSRKSRPCSRNCLPRSARIAI